MKINYDYEPVIILKDLFFELLYHWRSILVAALIGALLLGGYQYYTDREKANSAVESMQGLLSPDTAEPATDAAEPSADAAEPAADAAEPATDAAEPAADASRQDEYSAWLDEYRSQTERYKSELEKYNSNVAMYQSRIENNQSLINDLQDYMANSVYYNLDPSMLHSAVRTYLIKLDQVDPALATVQNIDPANDLLVLYSFALKNNLRSDEMKALLGTDDDRYISELVDIKSNTGSNTLELTVRGSSDDMVSKAMEFFHQRLMEACAGEMQTYYPHQLLTVNDSKNLYDQKAQLVEDQQKQLQSLTKYQNAIADAEKALAKLEQPVEPESWPDFMVELQTGTDAQDEGQAAVPTDAQDQAEADAQDGGETDAEAYAKGAMLLAKARAKEQKKQIAVKAAIGFALLALLTAVFYAVRYLTGERLRDSVEMTRRYGLLVFEDAPHSRARRPGKGIDGLIERLEFGKKLNPSGVGRQAALLLSKAVPEGSSLVLVSTRPEKMLNQVHGALSEALRAKDISVVCTADSLKEDRMADIPDGAKLVIVEEKHESKIVGITREAELVSMLRQNAIGAILL